MRLDDKASSLLSAYRETAADPANARELTSLYWNTLSQAIAECVRSKSDLSAFLALERDFVDFGLVPQAVENPAGIRDRICAAPPSRPFCDVLFFSEWLSRECAKILQGDKKGLLEREITVAGHQRAGLESEIHDLQRQRHDGILAELNKSPAHSRPEDVHAHLEKLEQLDNFLRQNLKFKRAVSKGTFFSVAEKRSYCDRENTIASLRVKTDEFLVAIVPKERAAIKTYSAQIFENLGKIIDTEDAMEKMRTECADLEKKQETISPLEIEARIGKEIDYLRDLLKLAAKRLHMESCPFIKNDEPLFTLKELASCLDRILEFDPRIFHNDRVSLFGTPAVLLVPGNGNALYDWKNNMLIVPMIPPAGNFMASIASGAIEYRLDTDEDKVLLASFNKLHSCENVKSVFALRANLTKDYIVWMTSEYKGYKTLATDVRKWFEHEIAPSRNDIYVPPQYQVFTLAPEDFAKQLDECESRLSNGPGPGSETDLWTASVLTYQRGKFEHSLDLLRSLLPLNPKNQKALYNFGFTCMKLMHKQEAIRSFQDYAKLNPRSWWTGVVMENIRKLQAG